MARSGEEQALFGAAVLLRKLERSGLEKRGSEVWAGVLADLGVSEERVRGYLEDHRDEIDRALGAGRTP